jgi:hypothetical protein
VFLVDHGAAQHAVGGPVGPLAVSNPGQYLSWCRWRAWLGVRVGAGPATAVPAAARFTG